MTESIDDNQKRILEEALEQFVDMQLLNKEPDVDEFVKRYPEIEHQIKKRIRKIQRIHTLFDSLVQADDSDFEEATTERNLIGQKIGNFEIKKMIGRGGMGVVYLAHDTKLKRSVAIKSIPAELQADSNARKRFRREAELLASLNHPNISVIHEIIEEEDSGYLILEYVPGETLAECIAREPLELREALSLGQQIAEAISAAHKKGIVHRDLKPGNIKITPEGRIKVLDFGLAKPSSSEDKKNEITATQPGRVIGTPAYMSPEQARGQKTDHRTDIWSFGCIMYQMLTGHLPFEGQTATDTLACIIERQPDWEALPKKIPENLRILIRRCLEKDSEQRLVDIADMAIEIKEMLSKPLIAPTSKLRRKAIIIGIVIIGVILSIIVLKFMPQKEFQPSTKNIRLVVLPFENLGIVEDESSSDVITEAITSRLVGISGLNIISRRSAIKYKNKEIDTKQIAEELRVDYILEGAIQRKQLSDPNSQPKRIVIQLIKASDDTQIWADVYDVDLSGVFQIESDVTGHVVQALDITLLEPERRVLATRPTDNTDAYIYYLRGNYYHHRSWFGNDWRIAIQMYEKAIELDPTFASAYAKLSQVHAHMYWHAQDRSKERIALAEQAARKALELNPDLAETHLALGFCYYWGHLDYDQALDEFAIAQKNQPNNPELVFAVGLVQRRQGKFDQALANIKKASELDPLWHISALEIGHTLLLQRKYPQAEHYYDRTILLAPDWSTAYFYKARLYLIWQGNTELARKSMEEAYEATKVKSLSTSVNIDLFEGNYQQALDRLISASRNNLNNQFTFRPGTLRIAFIYGYMGNNLKAKELYQQAIDILKTKIAEDPNDTRYYSSIGIAYAGLGQKEDAIRYGTLAKNMLPVSKEAMKGPCRIEDLARIYMMVGKYDDAIDKLEYLLSIPGPLSVPLLRLDPSWKPLRDHPRFQKLLKSDK